MRDERVEPIQVQQPFGLWAANELFPRPKDNRLHLTCSHQTGEALEAAIIGALDVFGEAAGGELSHAQVVVQALAADAVFFAARVGAVAEPRVARLLAFHSVGLVKREPHGSAGKTP